MYTPQDKYDFAIKDAKYSIGQGRGSAMGNAITWAIAKGLSLDEAFEISDKIFHYQQVNIEKDFNSWLSLNKKKLKLEVGLEIPTVYEQTNNISPF
jgi:hypothetical protein